MVHAAKVIHVEPGSELDRVLEAAGDTPVELERGGVRYRLSQVGAPRSEQLWKDYDPERAAESIRKAAGGWKDNIDAEAFKAYIYERRRTKNRPSVTPWTDE